MNTVWVQLGLQAAFAFLFRQIKTFGPTTDWPKIKVDYDTRIRLVLPGDKYDEHGVHIVNAVIDAIALVAGHPDDFQALILAAGAGDFETTKNLTLKFLTSAHVKLPPEVLTALEAI